MPHRAATRPARADPAHKHITAGGRRAAAGDAVSARRPVAAIAPGGTISMAGRQDGGGVAARLPGPRPAAHSRASPDIPRPCHPGPVIFRHGLVMRQRRPRRKPSRPEG